MLQVTEIFCSIQGESTFAGLPCVFVRLTGCNLRCAYCDTTYAYAGGHSLSIAEIIRKVETHGFTPVAPAESAEAEDRIHPRPDGRGLLHRRVKSFKIPLVEITGGEPLLQSDTPALIRKLVRLNFTVLIETNGSLDINKLPAQAIRIMDLKCPSSKQSDKMNWENLKSLRAQDQIKFVIGNQQDYQWAKKICQSRRLFGKCEILFSPAYGKLRGDKLAGWIMKDKLPVRLQIQLHKILWPKRKRGI